MVEVVHLLQGSHAHIEVVALLIAILAEKSEHLFYASRCGMLDTAAMQLARAISHRASGESPS